MVIPIPCIPFPRGRGNFGEERAAPLLNTRQCRKHLNAVLSLTCRNLCPLSLPL